MGRPRLGYRANEGSDSIPDIGRRVWAIAEGYIPGTSTGPEPEMTSHETACLINASDEDALVEITVCFAER